MLSHPHRIPDSELGMAVFAGLWMCYPYVVVLDIEEVCGVGNVRPMLGQGRLAFAALEDPGRWELDLQLHLLPNTSHEGGQAVALAIMAMGAPPIFGARQKVRQRQRVGGVFMARSTSAVLTPDRKQLRRLSINPRP